nr:uncharacterized protein LOC105849291 isoform X2 [Hydra vulgaris]
MVASLCQMIRRQVVLIEIIRHLITSHEQHERTSSYVIENDVLNTSITSPISCDEDGSMIAGVSQSMKPWPVCYQLSILPPSVNAALDAKDHCFLNLNRSKCRNQLLQCLYDDISRYTMYPSGVQYSAVLAAICSRYPHLSDFPSKSTSSYRYDVCPTLLESLKNKFKKERAPLIHLSAVAEHKKKFGQQSRGQKRKEDAVSDNQSFTRKNRELPNKLPLGEDETTIVKYHDDMKIECNKLRPDINMLLDCQQRTCAARAKDFDSVLSTADLKSTYPWLSIARLFLNEMRLRFAKDLDKQLHQCMGGMADKIMQLVKSKHKDDVVNAISAEIECELDDSMKKDATLNAAIIVLPRLFKESIDCLVTFDIEPLQSTPTIKVPKKQRLITKDCCVMLGGCNIIKHFSDVDVSLAMSCVFASYYIYNIQYPAQLKNTLLFYEHIVYGLSTKASPVTITRMANTLNE